VLFTSIPEIATAIILTVIFALGLGWLPANQRATAGNSSSSRLTLVLYDFG
jgi:peptide/nickel transport system permease protein